MRRASLLFILGVCLLPISACRRGSPERKAEGRLAVELRNSKVRIHLPTDAKLVEERSSGFWIGPANAPNPGKAKIDGFLLNTFAIPTFQAHFEHAYETERSFAARKPGVTFQKDQKGADGSVSLEYTFSENGRNYVGLYRGFAPAAGTWIICKLVTSDPQNLPFVRKVLDGLQPEAL